MKGRLWRLRRLSVLVSSLRLGHLLGNLCIRCQRITTLEFSTFSPCHLVGVFTLRIDRPGGESTLRVREGAGPLELRCVLTGDVRSAQARWLTPGDVGRSSEERPGELLLTIDTPRPEHSGAYICQAARVSDSVQVIVEPRLQCKWLWLAVVVTEAASALVGEGFGMVSVFPFP